MTFYSPELTEARPSRQERFNNKSRNGYNKFKEGEEKYLPGSTSNMKMRSCPSKPDGCSNVLFLWSIIDDRSMIDQRFVTSTAPKLRPSMCRQQCPNSIFAGARSLNLSKARLA
ncbi:hypothetical protein AVEN_174019-1 [Araneus ventricosus]|uniref:Uncharacterized protein n=1 Tax=Araneus ventricosus TaxID=182803 RepID=A0A4Y2HEA3_ARAVE|nr:hypothetical protein AVEN_174019-1 [Araneus ventricosus]